MVNKKIVGFNYLHRHLRMEMKLDIDSEHVIVDRTEWKEVVNYFMGHPEAVDKLGEEKSWIETPKKLTDLSYLKEIYRRRRFGDLELSEAEQVFNKMTSSEPTEDEAKEWESLGRKPAE